MLIWRYLYQYTSSVSVYLSESYHSRYKSDILAVQLRGGILQVLKIKISSNIDNCDCIYHFLQKNLFHSEKSRSHSLETFRFAFQSIPKNVWNFRTLKTVQLEIQSFTS